MKFKILIISLILNGCTPLFTAGGLMHSVVTNNTISTFFGLSNTAIKENTGKSFGDHFLNNVFRNDDLKSNNNENKDLEWVFK